MIKGTNSCIKYISDRKLLIRFNKTNDYFSQKGPTTSMNTNKVL